MKNLIISQVLCAVLLAGNGDAKPNGMRILGGTPAGMHDYPYIAMLTQVQEDYWGGEATRKFFCGGSIITPKHILTAGHCVHEETGSTTEVRLGAHYIDGHLEDEQVIRVAEYHRHPGYKPIKKWIPHSQNYITYSENDIAILKLAKSIKFTDNIDKICLGAAPPKSWPLTMMGWGRLEYGLESNELMYASVEQTECPLFDFLKPLMCTTEGGNRGDSGGPLVVDDSNGKVQVGVTTLRLQYSTSESLLPYGITAFIRVSDYLPWIKETIGRKYSSRLCLNDIYGTQDP